MCEARVDTACDATHLCSAESVPISVPAPAAPPAAAAVAHPVVLAPNVAGVVAAVLFLFLGGHLGPALNDVEALRKKRARGAAGGVTG